MNFFDAVLQAVNTLVQQNLGIFDGMGQNLFRAFATILVVWYGIKAALAAGEQRGGFHFANFVSLILMISFGFAMVNYYDAPIPGFGRDFHHLITDEAAILSNQIGQANAQRIADDTNYVLSNLEAPGITQPMATFLYALLWLGAVVTEALALDYRRLWRGGNGGLHPAWTRICSFFYRPTTGLALLGLAEGFHPIFLLSGSCRRRAVHRQPVYLWHYSCPDYRSDVRHGFITDFARLARDLHCSDLRHHQSAHAHQPHL